MTTLLEYTSYVPEKKANQDTSIALSNRTLSTSTLPTSPEKCDSCSSHIYPASVPAFHMKSGSDALSRPFVSIENSFRAKETPISVVLARDDTKDAHKISVLANEGPDSDYYIGDYTEQSAPISSIKNISNRHDNAYYTDKKNDDTADSGESTKMDIYTHIYVGSITIVTLYLVYRLLLK